MVAIKRDMLRPRCNADDIMLPPGPPSSSTAGVERVMDESNSPSLTYVGEVDWLLDREEENYDGARLAGTIRGGGIGKHVYDAKGPCVTQKTCGEGPGRATGLYLRPDGCVRRLAPHEAMRAHSFPPHVIEAVREMKLGEEIEQRLVGNSIPVKTLRAVIQNALPCVDPAQIPEVSSSGGPTTTSRG